MQTQALKPVRLTRVQQQALTRSRLLTAAEEVFARCGYGGASVDLVAAEAGFSKGAVYSNFEGKEAMFLELLQLHMERSREGLERAISMPADAVLGGIKSWLEETYADDRCALLMAELQLHARRNVAFAARYYELQDRHDQALANCLERIFAARGKSLPMPARDLARTLAATAHGLNLQRSQDEAAEAVRIFDTVMRLFL